MRKRAVLICWAAVSAVALGQSQVQIDAGSQPAVTSLAAVAQAIKECPRELEREKQWGKKPVEILRWYIGPPQNVVWDVMPSSSVRSPYLGYIEFSLSEEYWVPDEAKDKFERSDESSSAELAHALGRGPRQHRYEFDLGPGGLEISRMLHGSEMTGMLHGSTGVLLDDRRDETCWQKAARDVHQVNEAALKVLAETSLINVAGTVFLIWCDTEDAIAKEVCKLWLGGFYNGLAAAGVMVVATPKDAAKNNVVCFPQTPPFPRFAGVINRNGDEQLFHQILKYIKDHPQEADKPTAVLALAALQEAFPCKQ